MKQVCTLLVLACFSWHVCAQISLKGTVTGAGNEILIGAQVILNKNYDWTATDANGAFAFSNLRPGNYRLMISYIGYQPYEELVTVYKDTELKVILQESAIISDAVIISGVRAARNTPTTFSTLSKEEIERRNMAQDLPYLLNLEPSVVTTSDAGNGIGYTSLRIRGSDITRINVTINGIPLNDPESHAVYWVDIPDMASSVNSMQIQRGVGSSTNGAGAFGASMNLETSAFHPKPFSAVNIAGGSFNSWKTAFQAGTGLIKNHWYFEGRASALGSEGYVDRASSDLNSFFIQGGYYDEKTLIKAVVFGGREKTYQAWYGIDRQTMEENRTFNWAGAIFNNDGTIGYYDNQTDNYRQDHYQLHVSRSISDGLNLNVAGHYTKGSGYYEEYQQDDSFADYGLSDLYFGRDSLFNGTNYEYFYHDTITSADMIRRRWLDNHYYGVTWSLHYKKGKTDLILGGAANKYDRAKHFGEIIWSELAADVPKDHRYYDNTSYKNDFNVFTKFAWNPTDALTVYGDLQYRTIQYKANGIESHLNPVSIDENFQFVNPKAGISYSLDLGTIYASYSIAHREPIRDDFIDALEGEKPKPEKLGNLELGIRRTENKFGYSLNYYLMNYRDQLVLTGAINDDGAYIRKNAGKSYRTGIEVTANYRLSRLAEFAGNLGISENRTDYRQQNNEGVITDYKNTPIAFSPSVIGSADMRLSPLRNFEIDWTMKYVGKQYLDNTGNDELALDPFLVNDLRFAYRIMAEKVPQFELTLVVNNLLNNEYESNGFVYDNTPYFYPQAGINFLAGLNIMF
ncbi:MAG TPA: TonB-dependent receptor [Bacteroidales bacterium]|nr:TonB-dependent receptor [Bacteroidales bacterium]